MNPVTEVETGIFQVRVPVPFPLRDVNCYLVREGDGWTMLDCGLHDPAAYTAWDAAWRALGTTPQAVRRIVVTHAHPDHYGLAGHFQRLSGAPVFVLDHEISIIRIEWQAEGAHVRLLGEFLQQHGTPAEVTRQIVARSLEVLQMLEPQPAHLSPLHAGDVLALNGCRYRALWTPGHADGHMVLHGEENGVLFAGDHVLPKITPNIALWPDLDPNPLQSYLTSLDKVEALSVRLVLPGHRAPFADLRGRIAELHAHHAQRAAACRQAAGRGRNAYEICLSVFPGIERVDDVRMALVETLSHLEYLVNEGQLERTDRAPVRYRQVERRVAA